MTKIEWTNQTWNPVAGCTVLSPGCTNCYAMRMASRLEAMGLKKYTGTTRKSGGRSVWTGALILDENSLNAPFRWKTGRMVFVNSMSDLFHDDVPDEFIDKVWAVMDGTSTHTYQVLTKRPERALMYLRSRNSPSPKNVWIGVSVECSDYIERINILKDMPASKRFVSFEPLLGSVADADLSGIDWVIVGGESGPRARPIREEWVDEIRYACDRNRTAFFFKQWGGKNKKATGRLYKGSTWDEFPQIT